jgi:NAD(P)-dependent dehydrogenase (short-subunit alcohol dehydrogenase family)
MTFPERSVETCLRDWASGVVVETHIRDVLKCRQVDVSAVEPFVRSPEVEIRKAAARILAEKGRVDLVVIATGQEEDSEVQYYLLQLLCRPVERQRVTLEALEKLIASENTMIRDAAVEMFRRAGQVEALFPLIFSDDDNVVKRIKRYINEAGQGGETPGP